MEILPITLAGDNLGQRHRHFNSLVRDAKESGVVIQAVEALPEESAIDRLFKIDLAIQLKHVDYILLNLKDDDMLYVSRALKSTWLINHRDIINPKYLEDVLFPEMITPAVTKMKHWLYINLRDPAMCQEFYQHYKENTFEFAVKFLSHCSQEFILAEVPKLLTKLSPHSLKVLCEKCPKVAKIFFDSLATDKDVKASYIGQDRSYYNSVKCVLKLDADVFLDITEKYFNINTFHKLSPLATDYILRYHKTRFTNKLELYVAYLLHIPTLADRLSVEECQEVVIKLARASYLKHWFQYKIVEPLIKRVSPDKRAAFKKRVFVDKDVGDCEDKWPYEIPVPPTISDVGLHIFDDQDFMALTSPIFPPRAPGQGGTLFAASASRCAVLPEGLTFMNMVRVKTDLDRLFDEFRFIGFERALHELGQRLGATSSTDRRRDIFLVLVSKTGGRIDAVSALLQLASRHRNEPPHTRASVLRSLVKRAKVWRLPADVWQHLLDYGHGLGLDGSKPEAACREGLHAVVIRQLLAGECEQAIREAFMKDFSTLVEYSLKADERERVAKGLQNMLADTTENVEPFVAAQRLRQLLDVLKIYRIRVEPKSPAVKAVVALAQRDAHMARPLLEQLYNEKIARRELLRFNMEFRCDEAALLNALRHDPSVLDFKRVADTLAGWHNWDNGYRSRTYRRSYPKIFGRGPTQSTNFGSTIDQPLGLGSTAAPVTGLTFSRPANQQTGFNFGILAGALTEDIGSTAPTTGFTFGSSTAHAANTSSSSGATTSLTGFNFGIPAAKSTNASDSAPSTGFTLSSATALPSDVSGSDNSTTPRTGIIFGNPAITLAVEVSSSDSSTAPAPATGFSFGSPASQLQVAGHQTAIDVNPDQITGFGNPADQPKVDDSSTVHPTTFNGGVPQTMGFGGSSAQPMGFGGSSAQTMGFGGSSAQTMGFGGSSAQTMGFGGSSAQTMGFGGSSAQPMGFGGSSAQTMGFGGSSAQTMGFGGSSAQTMGFGGSSAQTMGFVGSSAQTMGFGGSSAQTMGFGGSSAQPMGFGGFAPPRFPFRLFSARQSNFDTFTSKLGIYFDQKQDLSTHLRTALKEKIAQGRYVKPARALASLLGNSFEHELCELDAAGKEKLKLAAALRACAHRVRPVVNLAEWGWRKAGVKAVATRAMRCRKIERAAITHTLAVERRTVTVALVLSMRPPGESFIEVFKSLAKLRPAKALSAALTYFRRQGDRADLKVWNIVKPLVSSVNLECHARLRNLLTNTGWIPTTIKPDYCITLYHALHKICKYSDQTLLRDLSKLLHECDESIESILLQMLDDDDDLNDSAVQYPSIYVRYLLLSRNEEDVEHRFVKIGNKFIAQLDKLRSEKDCQFKIRLDQILESLKYNSAFLDTKFSSCLSVIERISAWLQTFMPKEEYFKMYTKTRLTILYFKAVRQSMKQMPEIFADPKRRKSEGVEAVGFVFGRYIMKEVAELVSVYFDSIIELYTGALVDYLNCSFFYGTSRNKFIAFILKGILKEAEGEQRRLALYIFREHYLSIEDSVRKDIEELMIKDQSIELLVHAEPFNQTVPIIPYHNIRIRN